MSLTPGQSPSVLQLARDVGMVGAGDALAFLVAYCKRKVDEWVVQYEPSSLEDLLKTVMGKVGLIIEYVETDAELSQIAGRYVQSGEGGFARVPLELDDQTFALVVRLRKSLNGCTHVAVVDCRGSKGARRWFSAWHEIAHLLVQPQLQFDFRRTRGNEKEPVEQAMDAIAGALGFHESLYRFDIAEGSRVTLAALEMHRQQNSGEASAQSAYGTVVKRLKTPALLVVAEAAFKANERRALKSGLLFPEAAPIATLRATTVIGSNSAADAGLFLPTNMRVPEDSVIARVYGGAFAEEHVSCEENMSWWESGGKRRPTASVVVEAAKFGTRVLALIVPR